MGCRARRNDAEWSFHSKELQRRHAPQKPHAPPRSELTNQVKRQTMKKLIGTTLLNIQSSGQLRFLGLWHG